ncbi:MAG: SCP2 sterol-binding domain-containing protein [Candidatus Thorarchaeota archaeon]
MSESEAVDAFKKLLSNFQATEKNIKRFKKWNKTLAVTFTDMDKTYLSTITEGVPSDPEQKNIGEADVWIKVDSATWIGIMNDQISGMKAYTSGKLKIKGAMTDLLKLQKLM